MSEKLDSKREITLTQLKYFIGAAVNRSMTGAAAEMFVAQSAVSTAIAQLERTLGVQLFIRQPSKGLVLTSSGEQLLFDARSLLAQLEELSENVRGRDRKIDGVMRFACFVTLAPFILPQMISEIGRQHPDLRIELIEADFDDTVRMLRDGVVEAAITYDYGPSQGVTFDLLYETDPHVVLPANHDLAQQDEINLSELDGWDMVLLDLAHSREYFLGMLDTSGISYQVRHSTHSYEAVRSLVARGHGFSILNNIPKSNRTYDGGEVRSVPIIGALPTLDVCFAHATDVRPSARVRAVAAIAASIVEMQALEFEQ